jgi:hypothetical protein
LTPQQIHLPSYNAYPWKLLLIRHCLQFHTHHQAYSNILDHELGDRAIHGSTIYEGSRGVVPLLTIAASRLATQTRVCFYYAREPSSYNMACRGLLVIDWSLPAQQPSRALRRRMHGNSGFNTHLGRDTPAPDRRSSPALCPLTRVAALPAAETGPAEAA